MGLPLSGAKGETEDGRQGVLFSNRKNAFRFPSLRSAYGYTRRRPSTVQLLFHPPTSDQCWRSIIASVMGAAAAREERKHKVPKRAFFLCMCLSTLHTITAGPSGHENERVYVVLASNRDDSAVGGEALQSVGIPTTHETRRVNNTEQPRSSQCDSANMTR